MKITYNLICKVVSFERHFIFDETAYTLNCIGINGLETTFDTICIGDGRFDHIATNKIYVFLLQSNQSFGDRAIIQVKKPSGMDVLKFRNMVSE